MYCTVWPLFPFTTQHQPPCWIYQLPCFILLVQQLPLCTTIEYNIEKT